MNILVTGGAGYLGCVLSSALLRAGHEVSILDNFLYGSQGVCALAGEDRLSIIRGDVRDCGAVKEALRGMDAVVHLAALVGDPVCARHSELAREVNSQAALTLIDAAVSAGVTRFVFASTCSNYGRTDSSGLATEDAPLHPLSLYAESKVELERALLAIDSRAICGTVLRFSTLYGLSPRMRFDLTVNEFTLHLRLRGRLALFGEGFWRPYVHVRDAARAIVRVLAADRSVVAGEVFNVGDSRENYRKSDLVKLICARVPDAQIDLVAKVEDFRDYRVSFERIATRLDYRITRTVQDGIDEILRALNAGIMEEPFQQRYRNVLHNPAGEAEVRYQPRNTGFAAAGGEPFVRS